jgi:hypothetical protein
MKHRSFLLGLSLLIEGCAMTPVVWTKAGADEALAQADIRECRLLADDQAWRMRWERMWPPSFYNPRYMPPYYHAARPFWLGFPMSFELEEALVDFCMHSKGYRLSRLPY